MFPTPQLLPTSSLLQEDPEDPTYPTPSTSKLVDAESSAAMEEDDEEGGKNPLPERRTRGTAACAPCRRLKIRCVPAKSSTGDLLPGQPCNRCKKRPHECVFKESLRGRRNNRKGDEMVESLKRLENTLGTVVQSIDVLSSGAMLSQQTNELQQLVSAVGAASSSASAIKQKAEEGRKTSKEPPKKEPQRFADVAPAPINSNPVSMFKRSLPQDSGSSPPKEPSADTQADPLLETIKGATFFQPAPLNLVPSGRRANEPESALLSENVVSIAEAEELFDLFFTRCHLGYPVLCRSLHTPTWTAATSPFLFTCICAVASRYSPKRTSGFFRSCIKYAKKMAFEVLSKGLKSVEICQGYLLLSFWNGPAEQFENERDLEGTAAGTDHDLSMASLFSGISIRMAQDLNLHKKLPPPRPLATLDAEALADYHREAMNRERVWMLCFIIDRSLACQTGKPLWIAREDELIRSAKRWYTHPGAIPSDVGLSFMVDLHRLGARILETFYSDSDTSGLNVDCSVMIKNYLLQLDEHEKEWAELCPPLNGNFDTEIRATMLDFYHGYFRLYVLGFAIHHALETPSSRMDLAQYCSLAFGVASNLIEAVRDTLGPRGFFKYSPETNFVHFSYVCCFLFKLTEPAFCAYVDVTKSLQLVADAAQSLEVMAVDPTHTPSLYASLLRAMLANRGGIESTSGMGGAMITEHTSPTPSASVEFPALEDLFTTTPLGHELPSPGHVSDLDRTEMGEFWDNYLTSNYGSDGHHYDSPGIFDISAHLDPALRFMTEELPTEFS